MAPRKKKLYTHPKIIPLEQQTYERRMKNHLDATKQPQSGPIHAPPNTSPPFSPPPSTAQVASTLPFSPPQCSTFSTPIQLPSQVTPSPLKVIPFFSRAVITERKIDFGFLEK